MVTPGERAHLVSPRTNGIPTMGATELHTRYHAVTAKLRKAIIAGELPGGTRLIQSEIAESLSVSVTPVREALRNLMTEGLVDYSAYHGATVHMTSLDELETVYEMRNALIPLSVRAGVEAITADELDRADELSRAMEIEDEPVEWIELNREFHKLFYAASRRPRLHDTLSSLADLSSLYVGASISRDAERRSRGDADHAELIDAYRVRDVGRAISLTLSHNQDTLDVARASLTSAGS